MRPFSKTALASLRRRARLNPGAVVGLGASVMLATGCIGTALADDDEWMPPVRDQLTMTECGDCHMAFQPGFLPARSWAAMIENLSDHFGEDASISPEKTDSILAYMTANAGDMQPSGLSRKYMRYVRADGVPLRITENPDFLHEHDFRQSVWDRPEVVTKSNCPACHKAADRGYYEDD